MYTLYDVYSYTRDNIIKSIGLEYDKLDIISLRILLINNLVQFNKLNENSIEVIKDNTFWSLISNSHQELLLLLNDHNPNNFCCELDLILLNLNTDSSINLVNQYGTIGVAERSEYTKSLINQNNSLIAGFNDILYVKNELYPFTTINKSNYKLNYKLNYKKSRRDICLRPISMKEIAELDNPTFIIEYDADPGVVYMNVGLIKDKKYYGGFYSLVEYNKNNVDLINNMSYDDENELSDKEILDSNFDLYSIYQVLIKRKCP